MSQKTTLPAAQLRVTATRTIQPGERGNSKLSAGHLGCPSFGWTYNAVLHGGVEERVSSFFHLQRKVYSFN